MIFIFIYKLYLLLNSFIMYLKNIPDEIIFVTNYWLGIKIIKLNFINRS